MTLIGKVAIVTGAGGNGSGRAIAYRLARAGTTVVIADICEAGARDTAGAIEAEGMRASVFPCDVGNEAEVRGAFFFCRENIRRHRCCRERCQWRSLPRDVS